jgi:hypothetical protein
MGGKLPETGGIGGKLPGAGGLGGPGGAIYEGTGGAFYKIGIIIF